MGNMQNVIRDNTLYVMLSVIHDNALSIISNNMIPVFCDALHVMRNNTYSVKSMDMQSYVISNKCFS